MPRYFSAISSPPLRALVGRVAPEFLAHALVQPFGEGFGQPVGQRLGHDRGIIVVGALEALGHGFLADPGGDGEGADIIGEPAGARRDEIGERDVGAAFAARQLLAQRVQHRDRRARAPRRRRRGCRRLRCSPARSRTPRCAREPALGDDLPQHRLRVGKQAARGFAEFADRRGWPGYLPFSSQVAKNGVQSMKSISSASGISASRCVPRQSRHRRHDSRPTS